MNRSAAQRLVGIPILVAALLLAAAPTIEPRTPGERETCRVCGMFVSEHPEWIAQIVFADGSAAFFDGAKDLFRYLLAAGEGRTADPPERRIAAIFATSYYDLEILPAESAWYVVGSDVLGPMGPELVPHSSRAEAEEFQRDHGGTRILRFSEVTQEVLLSLR